MKDLIKLDGLCLWEDCDQDAVYCAGHALEFANVSNENEAILLRHDKMRLERTVGELEKKVEDLLGFINAVAAGSNDPLAAVTAELVLAEHGRVVVRGQNIGLGV